MCRNIRTLFNFEPPATEEEIRASALQFVRKLSGFNKPSAGERGGVQPRRRRSRRCGTPPARRAAHKRACARPRGRGGEGARARAEAIRVRTRRRAYAAAACVLRGAAAIEAAIEGNGR